MTPMDPARGADEARPPAPAGRTTFARRIDCADPPPAESEASRAPREGRLRDPDAWNAHRGRPAA